MSRSTSSTVVRGDSADNDLYLPAGANILTTTIDGGRGNDTLNLSNYSSAGLTITLTEGYAKSTSSVRDQAFHGVPFGQILGNPVVRGSIVNVEYLIGTSGNDLFASSLNGYPTKLDGGPGNDALTASGNVSSATLIGGTGNDWLYPSVVSVLVGGTLDSAGAHGDGSRDFFNLGPFARILDFEVNTDRLIFGTNHSTDAAWAARTWISDGAGGSTLMVNNQAEVTLAGVPVSLAQSIPIQFHLVNENGVIHGYASDDVLQCGGSQLDTVVLGAANGNDLVISFDIVNDVLQFDDGLVPLWHDTMVNGAQALLGTFDGGSVTVMGLSIVDVAHLHMAGGAGAIVGDPMLSAWSVPGDVAAAMAAVANG